MIHADNMLDVGKNQSRAYYFLIEDIPTKGMCIGIVNLMCTNHAVTV